MRIVDISYSTTLRSAKSYLEVSKILFKANRNDKYPYIVDLVMEANPLHQNIGQALELFFKIYIYSQYDTNKHYTHMALLQGAYGKRFKGKTSLLQRIVNHDLNTHDLRFLFVLCKVLSTGKFLKTLNDKIVGWQYHRLQHEVFIQPIIFPTIFDFNRAIYNLNIRYDRPFETRYPSNGYKNLPDTEVLIAGASSFYEELQLVS